MVRKASVAYSDPKGVFLWRRALLRRSNGRLSVRVAITLMIVINFTLWIAVVKIVEAISD
jgi:hypothetical protein